MTTDDRVMLLVWAVMLIALGAAGWAFQPTAPAMHMVDQPHCAPSGALVTDDQGNEWNYCQDERDRRMLDL